MSIETQVIEAIQDVIESLGDGWKADARPLAPTQVGYRTVIVFPDRMTRSEINDEMQRFHLEVLLVVRSKLVAETSGQPAVSTMLDDVRTVLDALFAADELKPGGDAGIEQLIRDSIEYFGDPAGNAGGVAGAVTRVTASWKE